MKKYLFNNYGQGLIEVTVAIAVIAVGLTAALTLTSTSLRSTEVTKEQVVAANLAREGVEIIRNIRDTNWLTGDVWYDGILDTVNFDYNGILRYSTASSTWYVDLSSNAMGENTELVRNSQNLYVSVLDTSGGTPTGYNRFIEMAIICKHPTQPTVSLKYTTHPCSVPFVKQGIKVISQVEYQVQQATTTFTVEEDLYNWHDVSNQ